MPAPARPFNADRFMRLAHGYMGMLIAPSLLFFAVSGGLQVFRLNEARGAYKPPAAFVVMGAFHKNQTMPRPRPADGDRASGPGGRGEGRGGAEGRGAPGRGDETNGGEARGGEARGGEGRGGEGRGGRDRGPRPPPKLSTVVLKWLSVVVSAGLFLSTALGIWMGLRDRLRRWVNLGLLAAGTLVPLALALV